MSAPRQHGKMAGDSAGWLPLLPRTGPRCRAFATPACPAPPTHQRPGETCRPTPRVSDAEPAAPPTHRARRELRGVVVHVRHHDDGCGCVREAVVQVPLHVCGLNDDRVLLNFLEGNEAGVGGSRTSVWDLVYRRSRFSSAQCAPGWGSRWRGRRPAGHSGGRWARPDPAAGGGATGASCADAGREAPGRVVTPAAAALTSAAHTWCRGRKEEDGARCRLGSGDEGQPARGGGGRHVCVGGLFL